ncbi:lipocalin family protein [Dyadobacter pollutisoli]|uniref:Lipocalin family protein n=1 Tax=Dyadobacter pollutisoli TaxID=2910158 RepID=A0A9E8SIT7_9BACT|nr:lipocalin family protein [Dyadobacter pollutisoli]WAC09464.1 lipocalin family protein [Dyadobacter pollutisoli]
MKLISLILLTWFFNESRIPNSTVDNLDVAHYSGTWYSLSSIPTSYDKGSRETTGKYTWNSSGGYFDVVTSYKKPGSEEVFSIRSKVYKNTDHGARMKCQFVWPFKLDYWVIELASDYSYAVVGHPEHKLLFIMSRKKNMNKKLYSEIVARCRERGYDVAKLTSQHHGE